MSPCLKLHLNPPSSICRSARSQAATQMSQSMDISDCLNLHLPLAFPIPERLV